MKKDKKTDVWMPLYIGDYLADTSRLTTEQHGAYFLLIMDYWRNGPPPDDDAILANICRASEKCWIKLKPALARFFSVSSGVWNHSRIDEELKNATASKEKARSKAAKAAEERWGKEAAKHEEIESSSNAPSIPISNAPSTASSNASELLELCPSPSPSPLTTKSTSTAGASASRLPADWEPGDAGILFCKTERPDLDPTSVCNEFRDYWIAQPGMKGRKTDWAATWRNWVRRQDGSRKNGNHSQGMNRRDERELAIARSIGLAPIQRLERVIEGENHGVSRLVG